QPVWMGIALAALLGQIGLPGGGFGHGYGSMADVGAARVPYPLPVFSQGRNPVDTFIPVAQITALLENPGGTLDYDGRRLRLPDIRLVYWAGGNPFHHHQDLNRLRRALTRPATAIVHDPFWTATARHADIVLPPTTTRSSTGSAPTPTVASWRPLAAASSSTRKRSPASVTTTVPAIPSGSSPKSGSAVRGPSSSRCISSPISRRRGCTVSSTRAHTVRRRRLPDANPFASIPTTRRHAASTTATSSASTTPAARASP